MIERFFPFVPFISSPPHPHTSPFSPPFLHTSRSNVKKEKKKKNQGISPSSTSGEVPVLTRRYEKKRNGHTHTRRHIESVEERENEGSPKVKMYKC
jgi:hypothetical protein